MSVQLKRSEKRMPMECPYRCCTEIYGKNTAKVRRRVKRAERRRWQAEELRHWESHNEAARAAKEDSENNGED